MKFVLLGLVLFVVSCTSESAKEKSSGKSSGKPVVKNADAKKNLADLNRMKQKAYTPKAGDMSPEGFNWVHREFAVIFSQSSYQHNWKGHVKEQKLKANQASLKEYIGSLQNISKEQFKKWPKVHQLPFLINTYHAHLLQVMLNKDFKNINDSILDNKNTVLVLGNKYSLNEFINKEILLLTDDPRIAFSLKCFAKGCPEFRNTIFNYKNIENMLKTCSVRYMNDPDHQDFNKATKTFTFKKPISKYKKLFSPQQKQLGLFLSALVKKNDELEKQLKSGAKIVFE